MWKQGSDRGKRHELGRPETLQALPQLTPEHP